jgi:hypothetical protein
MRLIKIVRAFRALLPDSLASTVRMIARHLDAASGPEFKSKGRQLVELVQVAVRGHFFPEEYFLYRFGTVGVSYEHMLRFLPEKNFIHQVRWALNDANWSLITHNKWVFHIHYKAMGVPVSKVLGYYEKGTGSTVSGAPLRGEGDLLAFLHGARPPSLVIKPVGGIQGKGVFVAKHLHYDGDRIECTGLDGTRFGIEKVLAHLATAHGVRTDTGTELVTYPGYLLEERAEDHAFCREINPYTASVMRIVTFCRPDGEVEFDFAVIRFGRKDLQVANWDAGGLNVSIDLKTGVLGYGVIKPKHGGGWHKVHPDSKVPFVGRTVPMWNDVLEACRRAAQHSLGLRSIGWDVILTDSGPCIIEGNADWALPIMQVHSTGYLTTEIRQRLSQFGVKLPERLSRPNAVGLHMLLTFGLFGNALVPVARVITPPTDQLVVPQGKTEPTIRGYG